MLLCEALRMCYSVRILSMLYSVRALKGLSIKYVTLFLAIFDPPPCHKLSHFLRPPLKYVTLWGKNFPSIFLMVSFILQNSISSKIRQVLSSKIADDPSFFFAHQLENKVSFILQNS